MSRATTEYTALTIPTSVVLTLLDRNFSSLGRGVAEGRYALWVGSGISLDRVDGLSKLLPRVIERLRTGTTASNRSAHQTALRSALLLAELDDPEIEALDLSVPFEEWSNSGLIVKRLQNRYSQLLDINVQGEAADYLLWSAVDIASTFPKSAEPSAEHLCIAALVLEGAFSQIASANWDGLIEAAMQKLAPGNSALEVCVRPEDLRNHPNRGQLFKFHGCAIRAVQDPGVYRELLIGRQSQITEWARSADHAVMRHRLVDLAVARPTLMVGLSAQDTNIQDVFSEAKSLMRWSWPVQMPANVFSEDRLSPMQQNMLKVVYGEDVYTQYAAEIEKSATMPAYGKPLLVGLLLHVLNAKFASLTRIALKGTYEQSEIETLEQGLLALRDRVARLGVNRRLEAFTWGLLSAHSRMMSIFRRGRTGSGTYRYEPLGSLPIDRIADDPSLLMGGTAELATALAVLGHGHSICSWRICKSSDDDLKSGTLSLKTEFNTYRVFLVVNEVAAIELYKEGAVTRDDDDVVLVYSTTPSPARRRSPKVSYGRTGVPVRRDVHMANLIATNLSAADLHRDFELAGGLV